MCTCPESTHNVTSSPEANGASGISSSSTTRIRLSPTMIVATIVPAIVFKYRTWPVRGYLAEVIMALFPLELIAQLQHADCQGIGLCGCWVTVNSRSEEHTSELQSLAYLVCRLLLEKKKTNRMNAKSKSN